MTEVKPIFLNPAERWKRHQNKHPGNPNAADDTAFARNAARDILRDLRGYIEKNLVDEEAQELRLQMREATAKKDATLFFAILSKFQKRIEQNSYTSLADFSAVNPDELDWGAVMKQITFKGDKPIEPASLDSSDDT